MTNHLLNMRATQKFNAGQYQFELKVWCVLLDPIKDFPYDFELLHECDRGLITVKEHTGNVPILHDEYVLLYVALQCCL